MKWKVFFLCTKFSCNWCHSCEIRKKENNQLIRRGFFFYIANKLTKSIVSIIMNQLQFGKKSINCHTSIDKRPPIFISHSTIRIIEYFLIDVRIVLWQLQTKIASASRIHLHLQAQRLCTCVLWFQMFINQQQQLQQPQKLCNKFHSIAKSTRS